MKAAASVAIALTALTVLMTWPLAPQAAGSLPGDYGDPLFSAWAMGWAFHSVTDALTRPATLVEIWNANIFFPEAQTLAFGEHFIGQSLLTLPVYWITRNVILAYNTAFFATFVLSGLGMFLLVRSLLDDGREPRRRRGDVLAGAAAAVLVAFNRNRLVDDISHLAILSIHWLPFALLGFHRYLVTDRRGALAGGAVALVALNLSSVAYTSLCAPLVFAFVLIEMIRHRRMGELRVWLELWAAAAAVVLVTLPFVIPYIQVRQRFGVGGVLMNLVTETPNTGPLAIIAFVVIALTVALGIGILASHRPKPAAALVAVALAGYLWHVHPGSIGIDQPLPSDELAPPATYLKPAPELPAIYREVDALGSDVVLLELPFGEPSYDLRYMFFAGGHGRRLANGHSAIVPPSFLARRHVLARPLLDPERAVQTLAGVTHVIVHRGAWRDGTGTAVAAWLETLGGQLIAGRDGALLFQMQSSERLARADVR